MSKILMSITALFFSLFVGYTRENIIDIPTPTPSPITVPSPSPHLTGSQKELLTSINLRLPELEKEIEGRKKIRIELSTQYTQLMTTSNPPGAAIVATKALKDIDLDIKTLEAERNMLQVQKTTILSSIGL